MYVENHLPRYCKWIRIWWVLPVTGLPAQKQMHTYELHCHRQEIIINTSSVSSF